MNLKNSLYIFGSLGVSLLAFPINTLAAPHFTLTPPTGNQTIGQNFDVVFGVDSGTEKVVGVDIKATFDSTKLEIVTIQKEVVPAGGYVFTYVDNPALIHNDTGMFEVTLPSSNQSTLEGPVVKQGLLKVTFKPKATGVATVNFTCLPNSVVETNIIAQSGLDVVDCAANQSGSYTIANGVGGSPTVMPTTLPQTGGVENTIALMLFGITSIGAALYLKLI